MDNRFSRTEMLIGKDASARLAAADVIVFGVGGVGGYVCEALARAGVGGIALVDHDTVEITNINRQITALTSTLGRNKADVMRDRILDINPNCRVTVHDVFFNAETAGNFDFSKYRYAVDAIDTVTSKLLIAKLCEDAGTALISCMGTGNKLDPSRFRVDDIYKTSGCPLARVMRRELKRLGIKKLTVLYSPEEPKKRTEEASSAETGRKIPPATISFVPPVAGMMIAGKVICDIAEVKSE